MSRLLARVQQTVSEQALFGAGDVLVAAVSGGADSTALALALAEIAPRLGARLVGLAHLNHQLRPAANDDEAWCRALAARLGVAFDSRRVDVAAESRARKTSIEDAARSVRYLFLSEAAADRGATRVAVGHTRNDQAETVLLRLARGAGPVGLAGIYPRAGQVIRPLLDARRGEVEAWLRERGETWREDESNQDRRIPRNRVRHELLPSLIEAFGAAVVDVLARQAALSRDDADWFELVAAETTGRLVKEDGDALIIEQAALGALHPAIARRVVLAALRRAGDNARPNAGAGAFVGFDHVEAVLALGHAGSGAIDGPGQRVEYRKGWLRFEPRTPDPGREGRRRGRPVPETGRTAEPIGDSVVSKSAGERSAGGTECAGSVSLEGHAPKGGRG